MNGYLVLADGSVYTGEAMGAVGRRSGEVVFNTGMTGYQEVLTDPSYCGQIVTMTYPLIGNYGVNNYDFESKHPAVRGFVVKEMCDFPSHWQSNTDLDSFLRRYGIIALQGIDTRALTRKIRTNGTMWGIITSDTADIPGLLREAKANQGFTGVDLVRQVTTPQPYVLSGGDKRVVLVDFGTKQNIVRTLHNRGCEVVVVPAFYNPDQILAYMPDGIVLSNGPGDPKAVEYGIKTAKELIGTVPLMGICLGHQILAMAFGGDTYKLTFGHRGANHPVKDLATGRVYITSQNHGYVVDEKSLDPEEIWISHRNLNDGTVEGMQHKRLPIFSIQYHPEAAPGPNDSEYLFDKFLTLMDQKVLM